MMRILDQQSMNRLFAVTDEIPVDRESLVVPLGMEGEGRVRLLDDGRVEVVLPDSDDLDGFLEALPGRLREAGYEPPEGD